MSELALKLIAENKRKHAAGEDASFLDLGNCGLTNELPDELFDCVWLNGLNLGVEYSEYFHLLKRHQSTRSKNDGPINKLNAAAIQGLIKLDKIKFLYLSQNAISDIKPLIGFNLISLNISDNRLSDLGPLKRFPNLSKLNLAVNQITDLSPLSKLDALNSLDVRNNQITDLSPLLRLVDLNFLDIRTNPLTDLSPLTSLRRLTSLYISLSPISDFSPLSSLKLLTSLELSFLPTPDLLPISNLGGLSFLDIGKNGLTDLSPLSNLKRLTSLILSDNRINDLSPLSDLKLLSSLAIEGNQINDLSPLSNLTALTSLNISDNKLTDLENLKNLTGLSELKSVNFFGNPIVGQLPSEVVDAGWAAVKYRLLHDEYLVQFKEVKVLLLGNTNVGKSNLLQYLETSKRPDINVSTHGIQYKALKKIFKNITLHCWDFGGQEYFHATHKLFFGPGALHIVMWSKTDVPRSSVHEECYDLPYWLRCIEQLTPYKFRKDIEVIVTENKIDLNANRASAVNQVDIKSQFENIEFHFTTINLQPLKRLLGFKELLRDRIDWLIVNQTHPAIYKRYLEKINNSTKQVLLISEIDKNNPETAETAMTVFHNMGILLYFNAIIPDKVFIKPNALLALLYKRILGTEKRQELSQKEIGKAVSGNELNLGTAEIIDLLKYFNLVFQIHEDSDVYFIPQYLKPAPALIDYLEKYQFLPSNIRVESDHFLMSGAMASVFSAYGQHVKGKETGEYLFWKDGIIIEKNETLLMVKFNRAEQYIELFPDIRHKNFDLQNEVVGFILDEETDENVPFVTKAVADEYFTLSGKPKGAMSWNNSKFSVWISADGKFFSKWDKLIGNRQNGILQIEAVAKCKNVDGKIETKFVSIFDYNRYLPANTRGQMKKIFISYSKKDLALVNEFIDHLSALKLDGKVAHWYCTELMAGTDWNNKIQESFDNADMVCFMISPNFMNTPYIHEFEIKKAFERHEQNPQFKIVPIILDFCRWKTESRDLTKFTALPYIAKPVMDFKNKNKAWYIIQECLRLLIDNINSPEGNDFYLQPTLPRDVADIYKKIIAGREDV